MKIFFDKGRGKPFIALNTHIAHSAFCNSYLNNAFFYLLLGNENVGSKVSFLLVFFIYLFNNNFKVIKGYLFAEVWLIDGPKVFRPKYSITNEFYSF